MSGARAVVSRSNARALVVAGASCRAELVGALQTLSFVCAEVDDPYVALAELCRRPLAYRALVLSLAGFYREELAIVRTVKLRFPHVDVWLAHADGRHASLAEAMRLGADGLLADDGLHRTAHAPREDRTASTGDTSADARPMNGAASPANGTMSPANGHAVHGAPTPKNAEADIERSADERDEHSDSDFTFGEPVLTADELRALLQEQPMSTDDES